MSLLRRGGTPLTGAIPTLEASNQAQIEDLVQRNRTLEHANKKLDELVTLEKERSKEAMHNIQLEWAKKQEEWKEGCEDMLSSCRIVQKQIEVELERERSAVIREMAVTREEKLQRLQRDFKITLFQIKEEELERKLEELEVEKMVLADGAEVELRREKEKCAEYAAKLKESRESLTRSIKEKEQKEAKYNKLIADRSNIEAQNGTLDSKLQRTQLQLEGTRTKITDIERANDELKRTNADLTRQLEKWQHLDTKGGEAAEKQHKERVALEFQLHELQETYEKEKETYANELAKEKRRVEKAKNSLGGWEAEAKDAKKEVAKLQKLADKLKEELEVERARVRPPSPQKQKAVTPPTSEDEEIEEAEEEPPTRKRKFSAKPESSRATTSKAGPSLMKDRQIARKTTGGKPPPTRSKKATTPIDVDIMEISDAEVEEELAPSKNRKGKAREAGPEEEEGEQEAPAPQKQKGKRKAVDEDKSGEDDIEIVEKPKAGKRGSRAPSEMRETNAGRTRTKPSSRAASKQPAAPVPEDEDGEEPDPAAPKKKKRKIIAGPQMGPFAFGSLNLTQFDDRFNGLDIPSVLSPVRDDEPVPQRSMSVVGSLGKFITKMNFPGQRKP